MALDILDPVAVINELFGNMYLFFAIAGLMVLGLAARFRWNMQFTIISLIAWFFFLTTVQVGFGVWMAFIVLIVAYAGAYIFWRYFTPK